MKKVFILLVMFFIVLGAYSTEQTKESLNDSTVIAQVNPTVIYFTEKLESLAKSLQVPAEHVYKVLIKQQIVSSYLWLSLLIIGFLTIAATSIYKSTWGNISYYDNKNPESSYWEGHAWNKYATFVIVFGFISLCLIIPALFNITGIITGIFNPEYGAIKEIMSLF